MRLHGRERLLPDPVAVGVPRSLQRRIKGEATLHLLFAVAALAVARDERLGLLAESLLRTGLERRRVVSRLRMTRHDQQQADTKEYDANEGVRADQAALRFLLLRHSKRCRATRRPGGSD